MLTSITSAHDAGEREQDTVPIVCSRSARDSRFSIAVNGAAGASRMSMVSSGTSEIRRIEVRGSEYD